MGSKKETKMKAATKAIKTIGTIDAQHQLVLDEPLPVVGPTPGPRDRPDA